MPRTFLSKLKRKAGRIPLLFGYIGSCLKNRPDPGRIMFFAFQGQYACNPKYICEEFRKEGGRELVWVVYGSGADAAGGNGVPSDVKTVCFDTPAYYRELAAAGVLVDNAFDFTKGFFFKRKGQLFVETMHGSLGIKRIGKDTGGFRRNRRGVRTGKATDAVLSNSSFETGVYETSFWTAGQVKMTGHPRNDIFFKDPDDIRQIREKVCGLTGTDPGRKILLYGPTFRKGLREDGTVRVLPDLGFSALARIFGERFGGDWIVFYRAHKQSRKDGGGAAADSAFPGQLSGSGKNSEKFFLDVSGYPDIQELLAAADAGMTDYSSWIFDFLLTGRPGFLYVPDLESYQASPGFYYSVYETPFPVCRDPGQLEKAVSEFDEETYRMSVKHFLEEKGCMDDGHASERAAGLIRHGN